MDNYKEIIDYLKPRRGIKASDGLRNKVRKTLECNLKQSSENELLINGIVQKPIFKRFAFYGVAASVGLVLAVSLSILLRTTSKESFSSNQDTISQNECIVFSNGEKFSGDEALAIAKINLDKMNNFEKKVQQHIVEEQEKMNNFINKTENQK